MVTSNVYKFFGSSALLTILCAEGQVNTFIDSEDIGVIKDRKWRLDNKGYIVSGRKKRLAREILGVCKGQYVHYKDGNRFNLRKDNLFITNAPIAVFNKFPGVSFCKSRNRWRACETTGNRRHFGWFETESEARKIMSDRIKSEEN